jgi:hypothetical protein
MGRAIDQDNKLEDHERRLKLVEDALEEMLQTKVHHVDLNDDMDKHEERIRVENHGTVIEPDEEFTPPVNTKRKGTTRKAKATATT